MDIVRVNNITKRFNDKLVLDNISFSVKKGEIFGLIGPNGAGKSTLINIITNLMLPNSGSIQINGLDLSKDYIKAKSIIGLVPQELAIIETLTPFDNLEYFGAFYGLKGKLLKERIIEALEVIGINGWCENSAIIIKTLEQMENMEFDNSKRYCLVAQTTINPELYISIVNKLSDKLEEIVFNDTICSATKTRQESAKELAKEVDCMIVIGGKHSSNTQKLVKVCEDLVPTFAIETKDELDVNTLKKYKNLGITAGASTPNWIIEEVVTFLENL
ncbi:TPA: ATP-binding cassette domain-containing protein [Clostridioides difficile]